MKKVKIYNQAQIILHKKREEKIKLVAVIIKTLAYNKEGMSTLD